MIQRVIVRPLAVEDIASAATWDGEQCAGLGAEVLTEGSRVIRCAQASPGHFRILRPRDGMRRVLTERFPYRIFFSIVAETLHVHAVLHSARHDRHQHMIAEEPRYIFFHYWGRGPASPLTRAIQTALRKIEVK